MICLGNRCWIVTTAVFRIAQQSVGVHEESSMLLHLAFYSKLNNSVHCDSVNVLASVYEVVLSLCEDSLSYYTALPVFSIGGRSNKSAEVSTSEYI